MKEKIHIVKFTALFLALVMLVIGLFSLRQSDNSQTLVAENTSAEKLIRIEDNLNEIDLMSKLDYYEFDKENLHITAYNYEDKECLSDKIDVNMIESEKIRYGYDAEYVKGENLIYLAITIFDEYDNIIDVTTMTAEPIYYDDGTCDALFSIEGKEVYLSEIMQSENENCFFLSLLFSSLAATIVTAIVKTIVITSVIIAAVVIVGYTTYELVQVTKEWINEKAKEKEEEKKKRPIDPLIYYYAQARGGKLIISSVPENLTTASSNMRSNSSDYWTYDSSDALKLVDAAGGALKSVSEIDSDYKGQPLKGYYRHYHCALNRAHAWFGTPWGQVY